MRVRKRLNCLAAGKLGESSVTRYLKRAGARIQARDKEGHGSVGILFNKCNDMGCITKTEELKMDQLSRPSAQI